MSKIPPIERINKLIDEHDQPKNGKYKNKEKKENKKFKEVLEKVDKRKEK